MSKFPYHRALSLSNFTVFTEASFAFSPGINAFIGENGSGKTHLLKAMYAYQRPASREALDINTVLTQLFQIERVGNIVRSPARRGGLLEVRGMYGEKEWAYGAQTTHRDASVVKTGDVAMGQPVFVPALDMMGHTKGFQEAYNRVFLDFDLTCYDILNLFRLKSRDANGSYHSAVLADLLGGAIMDDEATGRFYLKTSNGRVDMPMVAEGFRKIASIVRLQDNNWLAPGTTLYWDEPEVNINPIVMDELVDSILSMARQGIQVFLTTHSYVILKELDLQANPSDHVRFFSLETSKAGTKVTTADELSALDPNAILQQYGSLYNRDIRRATGRKPAR